MIQDLNAVLQSSAAQEKLARLFQYSAKTLKWIYLLQKDGASEEKMAALSKAMSMTRKVLRFPKSLVLLENLARSSILDGRNLSELLKVAAKVWLLIYFLADHAVWLNKANLVRWTTKTANTLQEISDFAWVAEILTNICWMIIEWKRTKGKRALTRNLVKNAADLPVAVHFWRPELVKFAPDGIFGVLGMITSAMALQEMWPKK